VDVHVPLYARIGDDDASTIVVRSDVAGDVGADDLEQRILLGEKNGAG
jgi:hypothetical protein